MTTLPGLRRLSGCLDERVYVATGYSSAANLALDMQALARPPLPRECQLLVDTGCNLRCSHCFLGDKHPILDYAKLGELMAELPREGMRPTLYFSEPFAREPSGAADYDRLEQLVRWIAQHQRQLVLTNGTTLDDDVVRLLHKHGPFRLYVSLMGATPATHDQVTRCPGSFDQMRAGVERLHRLAQSGTGFCFNVLVHRANQHELKAMLDLAVELNAQAAYLMVIHPSPDDDPGARAFCFPVDEFREAVRALGTLRHDYRRHLYVELSPSWGPNFYSRGVYRFLSERGAICPAGTTRLALHPETGLVYPCMKLTGRPNYAIGHWDSHQKTVVLDPAQRLGAARKRQLAAQRYLRGGELSLCYIVPRWVSRRGRGVCRR